MTNAFDTVFFDWGGVVADDPGDGFLADLLKNLGATDAQIKEIFQKYMKQFMRGEITESDYWAALRADYGFSISDTISEEFMKWTGLRANGDILKLISDTKKKGYQVALFSNVIEPTYNVLSSSGYYDYFDKLIASCKVGHAKPETEIYALALSMLNTSAERSIFIDDKDSNLIPARELGFATILAKNSHQIINDLNYLLNK